LSKSLHSITDVKEYWNRRPCNIRHSRSPFGSRQYFDEVEKRKYFVEPHIPQFAQFERWKGKQVLELGCGIGTDTINFARAGAKVTAIDISEKSLEIAESRAALFGLTQQINFLQADIEDLAANLPQQVFDLVYAFGVIHHTPNPSRALASIRAFMDVESELRIMLYARNSWKQYMIDAGLDQPEAQSGCPVAYTYTNSEIIELLKDYAVMSIEQRHIFPFVIDKYIQHQYELQPWFAAMPLEMFEVLSRNLGWHLLITAKKTN